MFRKLRNIGLFVLTSLALCGCLTAKNPVGDREQVSADFPFVGYWMGAPGLDNQASIISVFYDGDPESLVAVIGGKAYSKGDFTDYAAVDENDATVMRIYLSKKRAALSEGSVKEGFISAKYLNNPKVQDYELAKYDISHQGVLSVWYATQYGFNKLALEKGLLTEDDYDPVEMVLNLSSERLADFMNAYEGFPEGSSWVKLDMPAADINARTSDAIGLFFKEEMEQGIARLQLPSEIYEKTLDWNPEPSQERSELLVEFYSEETDIVFEVSSWNGSGGNSAFSDILADDQRRDPWIRDWTAAAGLTDVRAEKSTSASGKTFVAVTADDAQGERGYNVLIFEYEGHACIVRASWPKSNVFEGVFSYQFELEEDLKTILGQLGL